MQFFSPYYVIKIRILKFTDTSVREIIGSYIIFLVITS